ncbi:MAG: glycosyltransferase family 4 protein [Nodosilinea sp.]
MPSRAQLAVIGNHWFPHQPGGLDRYIYELVTALASDQKNIDLYGIGLPPQSEIPGLRLHNLAAPQAGLWSRLYAANRHSRGLKSSPVEAVNLHFALYGLAVLPNLPPNVPVTFTFHGPWAMESQQEGDGKLGVWLKRRMEQRVYRRCDRFIVLSKAFGQVLHQEYAIPWEKIHVIPGGVDTQQFRPSLSRLEARRAINWPADRFILFTPRRLVRRMGIDPLLTALGQLKGNHPQLWLAIAGKGPLREELEQRTKTLGLSSHVKFLGFLPDQQLPIAYQAADLTVIPSQALEGFGLVLLESLASGTPALCTPVGGMPEVIADFSPQLITESPSAESLASALGEILTGQIPLPGRDACRAYASGFSWPEMAQRVNQVLLRKRS